MSRPAEYRQPSSIEVHQAFRESLTAPCDRFDEIDLTVADSPPQRRSERETDKLFSILDEIEKERRSA